MMGYIHSALILAFVLLGGTTFPLVGEAVTYERLHEFETGRYPSGKLLKGPDGMFYGTTQEGGSRGWGTAFKVSRSGHVTTLASFHGVHGARPNAGLVLASDGNFYGTTSVGRGTVFRLTPEGELTSINTFDSQGGSNTPVGGLLFGPDGNLYGAASGGGKYGYGGVFRVSLAGELTTIVSFNPVPDGGTPQAGLQQGADGSFYGTTSLGGTANGGTVFQVTPSGVLSVLAHFSSATGTSPHGQLAFGSDGTLYGTTYSGGSNGKGTVFQLRQTGELTALFSFTGDNGANPTGELILASDGFFYGTTEREGTNFSGTVFRFHPDGRRSTMVSFNSPNGRPRGGLLQVEDGTFYGVTDGGSGNWGTIYRMTSTGVLTTVAELDSSTGERPSATLMQAKDGAFYGTTHSGGNHNGGTVFKVLQSGTVTTLAHFSSASGVNPSGRLAEGPDGNIYGTTETAGYLGGNGRGTVFRMSPTGELTPLVVFNSTNGATPRAGLALGMDGNFYGTTSVGGGSHKGTAFRITPAGELTTLVHFNGSNGAESTAELTLGSDGCFYGTTQRGGSRDAGTVFKMTPEGALTTLAEFSFSDTVGATPSGAVTEGNDGFFYGTTSKGGNSGGSVFKMHPEGQLTALASFGPFTPNSPTSPYSGLAKGRDGSFYGTTAWGGSSDAGTLFKVTPSGEVISLFSFNGTNQGVAPLTGVVVDSDGRLYGTAQHVVYRLDLSVPPTVTTQPPTDVSATNAILRTTVRSNGADTEVWFEYSTDPAFTTLSRTPSIALPDTAGESVLSSTTGLLAAHTTYYVRAMARNRAGNTPGDTVTFTTPAVPPSVITSSAVEIRVSWTKLTGNVNPNGFETTLRFRWWHSLDENGAPEYSFSSAVLVPAGTAPVAVSAPATVLKPQTIYYFQLVASNAGGETLGEAQTFTTLTAGTVDALFSRVVVPRAGDVGNPIPAGASWGSFGVPSLNTSGNVAFSATIKLSPKGTLKGIFSGEPTAPVLVIKKGEQAPGMPPNALFSSFREPLWNDSNDLAFLGTVSGAIRANRNQGIWSSVGTASGSPEWLVAQEGAQPPGVEAGAKWKSFTSVFLSGSGNVIFTATMTVGSGGVRGSNDTGLWQASPDGQGGGTARLLLREGQELMVDGTARKIKSFVALAPVKGSSDQQRIGNQDRVPVRITFADKNGTQALLSVSDEGDPILIALAGDSIAAASGSLLSGFGLPSLSRGGSAAFVAALGQGTGNTKAAHGSAIFVKAEGQETLEMVAREGEAAPGVNALEGTPANFKSFLDPAINAQGQVAFSSKATRGISGIWRKSIGGELQCVANSSTAFGVPGVPEAQFSSFSSLSLPDGEGAGPVFVAKITGAEITKADDTGIWAVDSRGTLHLVVREGDLVGDKTLKSFTVFSTVPLSPAQLRSAPANGQLIYRAFFRDGTQGIVRVQLP